MHHSVRQMFVTTRSSHFYKYTANKLTLACSTCSRRTHQGGRDVVRKSDALNTELWYSDLVCVLTQTINPVCQALKKYMTWFPNIRVCWERLQGPKGMKHPYSQTHTASNYWLVFGQLKWWTFATYCNTLNVYFFISFWSIV